MLRVLLVLEDYGELIFLQTVLKKIGFDVEGVQNSRSLNDQILTLNPDVVVMTAFGKRVRGFDSATQIKRVRGLPHLILIRTPGSPPMDDPGIAAWLDSPVGAQQLLDCIADLCHLDKKLLHDKFLKLRVQEAAEQARTLRPDNADTASLDKAEKSSGNFSNLSPDTMSTSERQERYSKFIKSEMPSKHGFAIKQVQEQVRELRKMESSDLDDLEAERSAFVEQLFKKS